MKLRSNWVVVILILVAMCLYGWTALGQRQGVTSTQWEYMIKLTGQQDDKPPTVLNDLGLQGWELVTVWDGRAYFKRQKK